MRENPTDEELRLAEREDAASDSLDPEIHQRMHLLKLRQGSATDDLTMPFNYF